MFERADMAGAYLALRMEALRSDPSVLAFLRSDALAGHRRWPAQELGPIEFDLTTLTIVLSSACRRSPPRMTVTAFS